MPDINADFSQRVVLDTSTIDWKPSPQLGVERRMLDRIGDEVARATSIVRYAAGSIFPEHTHGAGEEFLVLDGVFADEHGDYPAGTYVRNPWGSAHSPRCDEGCTILVKLRQMLAADTAHVVVDTRNAAFEPDGAPGIERATLHRFGDIDVRLERWSAGAHLDLRERRGGFEAFVLDGALADEHGRYPTRTWIRLPHGAQHAPTSTDGCLLWVKTGHIK